MMQPRAKPPGRTQDFVVGRGFASEGDRTVFLDGDNRPRVFLEMTTDPDHPHSDPEAAYKSLLSTLEPGAEVRFLQVFWPDEQPRDRFLRQCTGWPQPGKAYLAELLADLGRSLGRAPLPFLRRTILEVVIGGEGMWEWVEGAVEILRMHGLHARELNPEEVLELARWVFEPGLG